MNLIQNSTRHVRPNLALPIIRLALPIMIQGILFTLMGFVDSLMIGQLGEGAISGLGNSSQLLSFSFLLFAALSTGGSILISQYSGANQSHKLVHVAQSMISTGWLCGLLLGGIFYFFAEELIAILTTDIFQPWGEWSAVPEIAGSYLRIVAFAVPCMLLSQMVSAVFNASGDTKTPVKVSVFFNVVNFAGNYILIFGLKLPGIAEPLFTPLGLRGAAFATLIASAGQSFVLLVFLMRQYNIANLLTPNREYLKKIIELGYPNTIDGFYWQGARVFYTVLMNSVGAVAYAGYAIIRTFKGLFMLPVGGLQQATAIHIGKLLGAGKFRQAQACANSAIMAGLAIMTIPVVLLLLLAHPLLGLYKIQTETYELAYVCIWVLAFSLYFTSVNSVIPGLLRAGGDAKAVMNITLVSFIVVGAPASFILGIWCDWGLIGAFIGISLEEVFKAGLFIRRMRRGLWLKNLVR
ncbi:MATE family efflux transporter [Photobacterium sp. J15]|uniref:MATE family efflux transporter n=1 Tax=Photobacterium sp. J15 TaxID=265901 RepID=UPI000A7521D5|nr:MATE family efflux transporter [Photobacterium sp. J15]